MMTMDALTVAVVPLAGAETETIVARWGDDADPTPDRRHGTEAGRRRASVARALLRGVLEDMTGVHGRDWQFSANEDGKPFARLSCGTEGPAVSISHSGEFVAVGATALGLVGIDVERRRRDRPLTSLARIAFGPNERSEAASSREVFYKIWTLREAMAKATGEGLPRAADGRDRVAGAPTRGVWMQRECEYLWRLGHFEPVADYSLAIALRSSPHDPTVPWTEESIIWWNYALSRP